MNEYLPEDFLLVVDSPEIIFSNYEDIDFNISDKILFINPINQSDFIINSFPQPNFYGSVKNLVNQLKEFYNARYKIFLSSEGKIHSNRLKELIENYISNTEDLFNSNNEKENFINYIQWLENTLTDGFMDNDNGIVAFTEHQIFNRHRIKIRHNTKQNLEFSIEELNELNIGDFVVHSDKGIAKFCGFEKVSIAGNIQECLKLKFEGEDYLYVNLNYLHKIHKFSAQEGIIPKLSRLGTKDWELKKTKTKKRLKDIARDLIKLYAIRKMTKGFSFPADSIWQKEFEASFFYEDTPDQAQATDDIKKDMEDQPPRDLSLIHI